MTSADAGGADGGRPRWPEQIISPADQAPGTLQRRLVELPARLRIRFASRSGPSASIRWVTRASSAPGPGTRRRWSYFPQAANLFLAGCTAAETVHVTRPAAGETVLVHVGSAATGTSLVQQLRLLDVHVIGTASERNFPPPSTAPGPPRPPHDLALAPAEGVEEQPGAGRAAVI